MHIFVCTMYSSKFAYEYIRLDTGKTQRRIRLLLGSTTHLSSNAETLAKSKLSRAWWNECGFTRS